MNTEDKNNTTAPEKKKGINWLCVLVAIWLPLKHAFFIFLIFYLLFMGSESLIFLIWAILTILVYLGVVIYLLINLSKPGAQSDASCAPVKDSDLTSDEVDAFSAGLLGAALLGRGNTHILSIK